MSMSILANGQVEISQTTIFEVASGVETATVTKVSFFNTSSITQIVILYLQKKFDSSIEQARFELLENERAEYLEPGETLPLDNGDLLEAETTTASVVNFSVFGTLSS